MWWKYRANIFHSDFFSSLIFKEWTEMSEREKTFGWEYEKAIIGLNQSASTWCGQFHLILCGG